MSDAETRLKIFFWEAFPDQTDYSQRAKRLLARAGFDVADPGVRFTWGRYYNSPDLRTLIIGRWLYIRDGVVGVGLIPKACLEASLAEGDETLVSLLEHWCTSWLRSRSAQARSAPSGSLPEPDVAPDDGWSF